jgi:surface antigen
VTAVLAATIGLSFAACTMPDLSTSLGRDDGDTTGSIAGEMFGTTGIISSTDLVAARVAATASLDSNAGKASAQWDNPLTGAHGAVTPVAATYLDGNAECRDFLSSYRRDTAEAWLQGQACRNNSGTWEVRSIKAWQRP